MRAWPTTNAALAALGLAGDAGAFTARAPADKLVLIALLTTLFGAWCALRARPDRASRIGFLVAAAAAVGALACRAFALPGILLATVVVARAPFGRGRPAGAFAFAGFVALAASIGLPPPSPGPDGRGDPAAETRLALAKRNLFEARLWAERWVAESPDPPGESSLLLAEIDWGLRHRERARAIAADIVSRATDPEIRQLAAKDLGNWEGLK